MNQGYNPEIDLSLLSLLVLDPKNLSDKISGPPQARIAVNWCVEKSVKWSSPTQLGDPLQATSLPISSHQSAWSSIQGRRPAYATRAEFAPLIRHC